LLSAFLVDSLAAKLTLHGQADSARSADTAYTLQGKDTTGIKGLVVDNANYALKSGNADSLGQVAWGLYALLNGTGKGKMTQDSVYSIFWTRSPLAKADTFDLTGTTVRIYPRDAGTANVFGTWFFNAQIQAYGGIAGVVGTEGITGFRLVQDSITQLLPYAKGLRPAAPATGMVIAIDGDTTSDSLLVYLGGAWQVLKP
jgi:hypothetical protein